MTQAATREAVTAVWRVESARIVATLARLTGDLSLAEDLAQDALVAALESWPRDGIPRQPKAWLLAVARRRGVDQIRRSAGLRRRLPQLAHDLEQNAMPEPTELVDHVEDDVLRLILLTCHPLLTPESRAALTLRLVGGLTSAEIARALLVPEATMVRRITRAKRTLADAGVTLELPAGQERTDRLDDVLAVIYLIFNEGYAATQGDTWARPDLCHEGVRLARLLAGLVPDDPEVHGLQALLELQASRLGARTDAGGAPVLLDDQDRTRWDQLLIRRGLTALRRAENLGTPVGGYTVQAEIAACHARATRPEDTDWARIAGLYDLLSGVAANPVVEINRAVAHGRAHGPAAGLEVLAALAGDRVCTESAQYAAVHADLLARDGRHRAAAGEFDRAAALTRNDRERQVLTARARAETARDDDPGPD